MTIYLVATSVILLVEIAAVMFLISMFSSMLVSSTHGAPYVPVKRKLVKDLLQFGGVSADDIFYDLGCGDGRVLLSASRDFGARAMGYEIAPWPYLESRFLIWRLGLKDKIKVQRRNFLKSDLSDATFIYAYLFPKLIDRVAQKISAECQPGTKVLCPSFAINLAMHPGIKLKKTEKIGTMTAYLYELVTSD